MAQHEDNFFDEDLNFGVETDGNEIKEFEAFMEGTTPPPSKKVPADKIKAASEKDKLEEKEKGKALTEEERLKANQDAKKKEEEDARKFIEGEGSDEDEEEDELDEDGNPIKASSKSKATPSNKNLDKSAEDNDFEALAKDLFQVGIFTLDAEEGEDEEIPTTSEEFIERFNWEKQKVAEQMVLHFANKHGEEYRDLFDAVFVKGADPKEYVTKYLEVKSFTDMDMTDEMNQERVVETGLRKQGWEEDDIKAEVKKLKLNADLETTSHRYHKALIKSEEADLVQRQETAKENLERKRIAEQQYSTNIRSILSEKLKTQVFDGIPVSRDSASKTLDFLETKKWKLPTGELITDFDRVIMDLQRPENHAIKVKLGLLFSKGYEPGKPISLDVVSVAKKAVSTETNTLFQSVRGKARKEGLLTTNNKNSGFLDGL